MDRKAFTMIELLGIITIIGILLLMTVPSLVTTLKNSKEKAYDDYVENVLIAAETYVENDPDILAKLKHTNDNTTITIQDLINAKLVSGSVVNPKTDEELPTSTKVKMKRLANGTIEYTLEES